jgi:DNA-binding response OmpR family regulator
VREIERCKRRTAPILVISAHEQGSRRAQEINAEGFLMKPFSFAKLIQLVETLVEAHKANLIKNCSIQVDLIKVYLAEIYPSKNSIVEVSPTEDSAFEQRFPESGSNQSGSDETSLAEVGSAEVGMTEIGLIE